MKIKCPLCSFKNEEGIKICKNCNEPLFKQGYSEDNPYIKKKGIDRETIKFILYFLFIVAVLFFGAFGQLIALISGPYSFWWWVVFISLILPGILAILWVIMNILFTVVSGIIRFTKELFL